MSKEDTARSKEPTDAEAPGVEAPEGNLGEVRSELRRLGYLDHQVERYLLQDVLKPERPLETLAHSAVKVGFLIGVPVALLATLVLAGANGLLRSSPFDLLPLFVHLVLPLVLGLGTGFLALAGLLAAFLRLTHVRRIEAVSLGMAMVAAVIAVLVAVQQIGWSRLFELPRLQWAVLIALLPFFAYLVFKVVHGGLLTLAIRLTDLTPEQPSSRGRWVVGALLAATVLLLVPAALEVETTEAQAPSALPVGHGGRVVVIGVDGVLAQELDYLVAAGELPALAQLAARGTTAAYERSDEAPIAFWATVATGRPSTVHGLESVDTFRPRGVSRPLRRNGWARHYWTLGAGLGTVEYRPILANSRKAWSFWELAGRGGAPSLVVGWWGTFPVEPVPGTVVAHGGYQLLAEGSELAVHPADQAEDLARLAAEIEPSAQLEAGLRRSLASDLADELIDEVVRADTFYLEIFRRRLEDRPRAAAVYLAGLDIAAAKADLGTVAFADLMRRRLRSVDSLVADLLAEDPATAPTVVVVVDPGRRGGVVGRAFLHRPAGCDGGEIRTTPEALGAAVIRALGLPQSRELPEPTPGCGWPEPSMVVDTYGPRRPADGPDQGDESEEYLENLKSLGYL